MELSRRVVWRLPRAGSLDRLERRAEALSAPGPGQAQVTVRAIGLNFADVFACLGLYSATPPGAFVPGLECAGVVQAVGPGLSGSDTGHDVRPGDRVIGLTRFGAYATALNLDVRYLKPIPPAWSFADGAAFPVQALTAWYALVELGRVDAGDAVLVHSAAGGVGLNALAIAAARRATVVATVGRPEKCDWLVEHQALAPDRVIVRERRRFGEQLDACLARLGLDGLDVVLDPVVGPFFRPAYARLRPEGRMVVYGAADLMPAGSRPSYPRLAWRYLQRPRLDPLRMIAENRSLMAFNLVWLWERVDRLSAMYDRMAAGWAIPPFIGRHFAFAEAPAALRFLQSGASVGKLVLEVEPD